MGLFDVKEKPINEDKLKELSYNKLVEFINSEEFKKIYFSGKINNSCSWLNNMVKINITESEVNQFTFEVKNNSKNGFSEFIDTVKFKK